MQTEIFALWTHFWTHFMIIDKSSKTQIVQKVLKNAKKTRKLAFSSLKSWCAKRDGVRITECDLPLRLSARLRRLRSFFLFPGKASASPGAPVSGFKPSRPEHEKIRQPLMGLPYFWCARRDLNPHARSEH